MPIYLLEKLFTYWCIDIIKVLNLGRATMFNTPGVDMVPEMELVDIHWDFTHCFTLFVSITLILGISNKMTSIIREYGVDIVGSTGEVLKDNAVYLTDAFTTIKFIPQANDSTRESPKNIPTVCRLSCLSLDFLVLQVFTSTVLVRSPSSLAISNHPFTSSPTKIVIF